MLLPSPCLALATGVRRDFCSRPPCSNTAPAQAQNQETNAQAETSATEGARTVRPVRTTESSRRRGELCRFSGGLPSYLGGLDRKRRLRCGEEGAERGSGPGGLDAAGRVAAGQVWQFLVAQAASGAARPAIGVVSRALGQVIPSSPEVPADYVRRLAEGTLSSMLSTSIGSAASYAAGARE